jgi:hypothetical protein
MENNKQKTELLELIAVSGELPADAIYRLGGGRQYKDKLIAGLKNDKLIHVHYKDKIRGYRLNIKAKRILLKQNHSRFEFFLGENIKSEITRRLRLHRIANALVTMYNSGAVIFRDDKPDVFNPQNMNKIKTENPCFYTSREFKEIGKDMLKAKNARAVGILLTGTETLIVYNTESCEMKWDYNSEKDMKAVISKFLMGKLGVNRKMNGLLLGNNMEMLLTALNGKSGKKRGYFFLDNTFDSFIYITNDRYGETSLKLLYDTEKRTDLDDALREDLDFKLPDKNNHVENDAMDKNGNPVLFAYLPDMPRLERFCKALNPQKRTGMVICFDFQKEVLEKYCGENIVIDTIDFAAFERSFFGENN